MQNKRNEESLKDYIYLTVSLLHTTLLEHSFVHPTILKSSGNKCAIFRTNCATLNVTNSRENPRICPALMWNFGRRAIVFRLYLNAL